MKTLADRKALGLDGAVSCASLARMVSIAGSTGTVLLIVRFLSHVEQGYYYTLPGLVALQMVFELGFSFVVQQLSALECVHLRLQADGSVLGDRVAHARLASALQLSVRWYSVGFALPSALTIFARGRHHYFSLGVLKPVGGAAK